MLDKILEAISKWLISIGFIKTQHKKDPQPTPPPRPIPPTPICPYCRTEMRAGVAEDRLPTGGKKLIRVWLCECDLGASPSGSSWSYCQSGVWNGPR